MDELLLPENTQRGIDLGKEKRKKMLAIYSHTQSIEQSPLRRNPDPEWVWWLLEQFLTFFRSLLCCHHAGYRWCDGGGRTNGMYSSSAGWEGPQPVLRTMARGERYSSLLSRLLCRYSLLLLLLLLDEKNIVLCLRIESRGWSTLAGSLLFCTMEKCNCFFNHFKMVGSSFIQCNKKRDVPECTRKCKTVGIRRY